MAATGVARRTPNYGMAVGSPEWQDSVREEDDCQERKSSHLASARRELERHLEWKIEGQLPFATAHAPGRAARTFVAEGKKLLGVLI